MAVSRPSATSARGLFTRLTARRLRKGAQDGRRLRLPPALPTPLGCDAVGLPVQHGPQVMDLLPRVGCVFDTARRWWWIVPAQSDVGVRWPAEVSYAADALVGDAASDDGPPHGPRLIHWPEDTVPYTHPLMLYITVCTITGNPPDWRPAPAPAGPRPERPGALPPLDFSRIRL